MGLKPHERFLLSHKYTVIFASLLLASAAQAQDAPGDQPPEKAANSAAQPPTQAAAAPAAKVPTRECPAEEKAADTKGLEATINGAVEGAVNAMLKVLFFSPVGSAGDAVLVAQPEGISSLCPHEECHSIHVILR